MTEEFIATMITEDFLNRYRAKIEHDIDIFKETLIDYIRTTYLPTEELKVPLKDKIPLETWNRGYTFFADKIFVRKDGCVMMEGEYCGKRDVEFISYIHHIKDFFVLYENLK